MKLRSVLALLTAALTAAVLGACGGGGTGGTHSSATAGSPASATVHLVDAPSTAFSAVNVNIAEVQIGSDAGWITLATPGQTYDLLQLTGGLSQTLAEGATLPPGHYSQLRLILGSGNTVTLSDGSAAPLKVPSGMQTGIKMNVNVDVAAGDTSDVWIDFDAAHSVQLHGAGASGQYILRPVVTAFTQSLTGSVSGTLADVADGSPLAGALVYAETVDGSGTPQIVRGTVAAVDGSYTVDLLPLGDTYYLVSMPVLDGGAAYAAQASGALSLTTATPDATFDGNFTQAAGMGGVTGTLTPTAAGNQSDTVNLLQPLGAGGQDLIVATTVADVATDETYTFAAVPVGDYAAQATRTTDNGDGTSTVTGSAVVGPQPVTDGGTTTLDIGGLP